MATAIRTGLVAALPAVLVDELLAAHEEAKKNYYLGGLRLSAVEGGRFCEAAYRLLQFITTNKHDALGVQLDTDRTARDLQQLQAGSFPDSVRLHIPRALRVVYDIRNKRDTAHLGDGIDPNLQDATLVVSTIDWVLAEFIRLYHNMSANQAQTLVESIVTRLAPVVEDFDGFLKVLKPDLRASQFVLVLLYHRGSAGATLQELASWVKPSMRANLRRTLTRLVHDDAFIHEAATTFWITRAGQQEVEKRGLIRP
ncbi:MAG TPA: hypothetical protein VHC20_07180 [Candidatus Paceibacterota bacterium]|jgi:hypothetical protein|nr:hypothetical protein [Candidatus Paceibacterota bacterium]